MSVPGGADSVGERLRQLRRRLGLSQEHLARRLGVSFATVNRWESGRTGISARWLTTLAELEAELDADATAGADGATGADSAAGAGGSGADSAARPIARSSFVGRERPTGGIGRWRPIGSSQRSRRHRPAGTRTTSSRR